MGMFGPDVFDVINETTNQMKLEKNKQDAYRRYLNYGDLEAKQYLKSIGEDPLPPSVPEIRENQRKVQQDLERLKHEQQPVVTTTTKLPPLKTIVIKHAPMAVPQHNLAPPVILPVPRQQQSTMAPPPTTTAPVYFLTKLTDVMQDKTTLLEAGIAAVAGFVLGGQNRLMAAIVGFSVPITVKTLI
jgi:hypothetical protein